MLYDLNELVNETEDVDYFTIKGIPYQIGDIPEKYRKAILAIDPKGNIIEAWRPVIAGLLEERNQHTPELTETIVGALIPIILKKTNAAHS